MFVFLRSYYDKNIVLFTSIVTTYYLSFCSIVDVQSFFRISLPSNGVVSVNNAKLMGVAL